MNDIYPVSIELTDIMVLAGKTVMRFGKPEAGKGQLITLRGGNGAGKSSFLAGVASIFEGGWNPDIIRTGCDEAEARMLLSDGTDIRRWNRRDGYDLKVFVPDGTEKKAPQSYLQKLAGGEFGFDPIAFDQAGMMKNAAGRKKQLDWILKVMPFSFTAAEISEAMGETVRKLAPAPPGSEDINGLGKLQKTLEEKRAAIGNRRDERAGAVETFRKTLLESDNSENPRDWKTELAEAQKRLADLERSQAKELKDISVAGTEARKEGNDTKRKADDAVTVEFARLQKLAREASAEIDQDSAHTLCGLLIDLSDAASVLKGVDKEESDAIAAVEMKNSSVRRDLAVEINTLQLGFETQAKMSGIREQMERSSAECRVFSEQWDAISQALKNIEGLRRAKLKDLPVDGLEVDMDGLVHIHGIPWPRVNQAKRWLKSMEIGCQGMGELGLMVADEAEHLEPINWKMFEKSVVDFGITVIAARGMTSEDEVKKFGRGLRSEPAEALSLPLQG